MNDLDVDGVLPGQGVSVPADALNRAGTPVDGDRRWLIDNFATHADQRVHCPKINCYTRPHLHDPARPTTRIEFDFPGPTAGPFSEPSPAEGQQRPGPGAAQGTGARYLDRPRHLPGQVTAIMSENRGPAATAS